jgi:hypothetical protein
VDSTLVASGLAEKDPLAKDEKERSRCKQLLNVKSAPPRQQTETESTVVTIKRQTASAHKQQRQQHFRLVWRKKEEAME